MWRGGGFLAACGLCGFVFVAVWLTVRRGRPFHIRAGTHVFVSGANRLGLRGGNVMLGLASRSAT